MTTSTKVLNTSPATVCRFAKRYCPLAYLIINDFKSLIQSQNLQQIIGNDPSILSTCILKAQKEAISYLVQKYITAQEFQDLNVWNPAIAYKPTNRVYLDASAYNSALTYTLGSLTLQAGQIYQCSSAITVPETFNAAHWTLLGNEFDLYYVQYPNPLFCLNAVYAAGDVVYWGTNSWTCITGTLGQDHNDELQAVFSQQIPFNNSFPGSTGQTQWRATGAQPYTVPASTPLSNTTYWTVGDNRNPQLVGYAIDIAVYHATPRLADKNVPDIRVKRYDDAIKWLKMAGKGDITADLPAIQPPSGRRIRWGGDIRRYSNF